MSFPPDIEAKIRRSETYEEAVELINWARCMELDKIKREWARQDFIIYVILGITIFLLGVLPLSLWLYKLALQ